MSKRLASLIFSALVPVAASAQSIVPESTQLARQQLLDSLLSSQPQRTSAENLRYVPVWSAPDGRILIAVAGSSPALSPLEPAAPTVGGALDWRLVDATSLFQARLELDPASQWRTGAGIGVMPMTLSDPAATDFSQCGANALATNSCVSPSASPWYFGNADARWTAGRFNLDVGMTLSWLSQPATPNQASTATLALPTIVPGNTGLPSLVIPGTSLGRFSDSAMLGARGQWALNPSQNFDIGASIGRIRLAADSLGARTIWQQTALSLGLGSSALSTSITGRLYSPLSTKDIGGQRWTGIDVGVTWHTPWQADLSIGAQNLWTNPPLRGDEADSQARVPYIQYHQDL
ncbi:hypothetical protein [Tahibacter amnicola]|uniref:Uncharacterized protein n=1 Tax=Tahibacter amnicola TaxID=2976241 RepID=A0ABY6BDG7_9GAMM|nr:hypothetical protein [Tahibacter amnicola]UXI67621.1 hypothetical protein N4264_23245 [Tahibacter amnicola]